MEYLLWLQGLRSDFWNTTLMAVTELVTSPAMYLFVAVLYWCFAKKAAMTLAMNLSVGSMLNQTLKNVFCVYRPWLQNPALKPVEAARETATGYSFPSGHTQLAATEFLSIAMWQKKRKWLVAVCFLMTFLVMFTRNYLGVHTLPDVIASFFIACFVVVITPKLQEWIDNGRNRDFLVAILLMALSGAALIYTTYKSYPMDYLPDGTLMVSPKEMITDCYSAAGCVFGFSVGWLLERRIIKFSTDVSGKAKAFRGIVGSVLLLLYVLFLQNPIVNLDSYWGNFAFLFFAFVFILFLYPLLFTAVEKVIQKKKLS